MTGIRSFEKILVTAALGTLSLSWMWAERHVPQSEEGNYQFRKNVAAYCPADDLPPKRENLEWEDPPAQTRGAEWVYDLFTPPEIFYDRWSRQFTVKPPPASDPGKINDASREPVRAPAELFRLQLVGFVGGEGSYLGSFENLVTTEHVLARGGRNLPELGVTIRDFHVAPVRRAPGDSMPTTELIATAIVRDERTGEDVVLTNLERAYARP